MWQLFSSSGILFIMVYFGYLYRFILVVTTFSLAKIKLHVDMSIAIEVHLYTFIDFDLWMFVYNLDYGVWFSYCFCCSYDEVMFGCNKSRQVSKKKFARENKNRY